MADTAAPRHPGGADYTRRLLDMAALAPCRILDMGAGGGGAVALLRALGFDAAGIDLNGGAGVLRGDFLRCPFSDGHFDAVLSECAFFISGDPDGALREARRLLRPGGRLLLADVCPGPPAEAAARIGKAGFRITALADETAAWKDYYIGCIWDGTVPESCTGAPRGKYGYLLAACERT